MGERADLIAKAPEVKQSNSNSRVRRTERLQSMDTPVDRILFLQRTAGNQAVSRLVRSGGLQAKLRIGQTGDVYEQEADRVAEQVMRMPEPQVQRQVEPDEEEEEELVQPKLVADAEYSIQRQVEEEEEEEELIQTKPIAGQITPLIQRQEENEEEEEELIQPKTVSGRRAEVTPDVRAQINAMKGGGHPLHKSTRAFFEQRFGYDFSQVRIHTSRQAAKAARLLNAKAFTAGREIAFGPRQFSLGTAEGNLLLAHELTHVVQQANRASLSRYEPASPHLIQCQVFRIRGLPKGRGVIKHTKEQKGLIRVAKWVRKVIYRTPSVAFIKSVLEQIDRKKGRLIEFNKFYTWVNGTSIKHDIQELIDKGKLTEGIKSRLPQLSKLPEPWPEPPKVGGLTKAHREQAKVIAYKLKRKPGQVHPISLAEWLFCDKVWTELCRGGNISYYKEYLPGRLVIRLFEGPTPAEVKMWQKGGAEMYLERIAKKIYSQAVMFAEDIAFLQYEFATRAVGHEKIAGSKTKIRKYQKDWETLGRRTGTLTYIKTQLLSPKYTEFMKYLWSEKEREKLRLWKKAT